MQITQESFLNFLGQPKARFVIPVFQRVYSWSARQCTELWDDIMAAGATGERHFTGIVLYSVDPEGWNGCRQIDIIDGQQRMTTLTLLLTALSDHLSATRTSVAGQNAPMIQYRYLKVSGGGTEASKMLLSQMDRDTLAALVGAGSPPEESAQRLLDNLMLFGQLMTADDFDPETLWRGLGALEIASVQLEAEDSPQTVFESLNSKGMPLNLADRVRNLLIASSSDAEQDRLLKERWIPLEDLTANAEEPTDVTCVMQSWLAQRYRQVRIFEPGEVYGVFKRCLRDEYDSSFDRLLADLSQFAHRFLDDQEFREKAVALSQRWIADMPEESISELKLFGD